MQLSKKIVLSFLTLLFCSNSAFSQIQGAAGGGTVEKLLCLIEDHTKKTLEIVNRLPSYLEDITLMAKSWLETEDEQQIIPTNQELFGNLNENYTNKKEVDRLGLTNQMALKYLSQGSRDARNLTPPTDANQLVYSILFDKPLNPGDKKLKGNEKKYAFAYLQNLATVNYILPQVNEGWKNGYDKNQYRSFYNTLSSIQSFNAYVVTGLYKQSKVEDISTKLTDQASNSEWFEQVATEQLGLVLRHTLMYISQVYVQLNRMALLQEQQLAAQTMTNSLLIMQVQYNVGEELLRRANKA